MKKNPTHYHRHRFPPAIISHAVSLYYRFTLSLRAIEDLLAERGVIVSYESIRRWCKKFGPAYARRIKKHLGPRGDVWHMDEMVINIQGDQYYLWRAVDQDGDTLDILIQKRKNKKAALRFLRKTVERSRQLTPSHSHRQTTQLWCGEERTHAEPRALPRPLCKQSLRSIA